MTIKPLRPFELRTLEQIQSFAAIHGRPPTYRELRASPNAVAALKRHGHLLKGRGMQLPGKRMYQTRDAAHILGVGHSTLIAWIARGTVNTIVSNGGQNWILESELQRLSATRVAPQFGADVNPDPRWCDWLAGFTDGEGTFSLTANNRPGGARTYTAKYQVAQRSDRRATMESIKANLGCGFLYERKHKGSSGPCTYFLVQDKLSLSRIIVPLFDAHPLQVKAEVFAVWRKCVIHIAQYGGHATAELDEAKATLTDLYRFHG